MAEERVQRRLAAILAADVVGYVAGYQCGTEQQLRYIEFVDVLGTRDAFWANKAPG